MNKYQVSKVVSELLESSGIEYFTTEHKVYVWFDIESNVTEREVYLQVWDSKIVVRVNDLMVGYEDDEIVSMVDDTVYNVSEAIEIIKKYVVLND